MNKLVEISNIFNVICQLVDDIKFYHMGTVDDINRNHIDNNFTNFETPNGIQYPQVLALYPEGNVDFDTNRAQYNFTLLFMDLQGYKNDASGDTRSYVETTRDLSRVATNFFKALKMAQKNTAVSFQVIQPVSLTPALFQHNNGVVVLRCDFAMSVFEACNTQEIDFNDLQPPFTYPVESWDYEDPNNQNDSV